MRALQLLRAEFADAVILNAPNAEPALIALIENLQREQLNAFEEAGGIARILGEFAMTQEALAGRLGKSPSAVANRLRLLRLSPEQRERILITFLSEPRASPLALDGEAKGSRAGCGDRLQMTVRDLKPTSPIMAPRSPANANGDSGSSPVRERVLNTVKDQCAGVAASAKDEKRDTVDVVVGALLFSLQATASETMTSFD